MMRTLLLATLIFLPLIGGGDRPDFLLATGEGATVECDGDTLYVVTQSRTRLVVECLAPGAQPVVPTPTPGVQL